MTACPEIMVHERGSSGKDELLLLACDGVWDVFENDDAGEFLVSQLEGPLGEVNESCSKNMLAGGVECFAGRRYSCGAPISRCA